MAHIDYYIVSSSPFAYMGHRLFHDMARRHGMTIRYKPVDIFRVWQHSGSVPGDKRTPARMRYRRIELQRISAHRGVPLNHDPKIFPPDPTLADCCVIALAEAGANPEPFLWRVHEGAWLKEKDIRDAATIRAWLEELGHDAAAILAAAGGPQVAAIRERNTDEAIAADAMGAPVYVYRGEPFWGQDRLEYLEEMIVSGREPFSGLPTA